MFISFFFTNLVAIGVIKRWLELLLCFRASIKSSALCTCHNLISSYKIRKKRLYKESLSFFYYSCLKCLVFVIYDFDFEFSIN